MSKIQVCGTAFAGFRQLPGGNFAFTMVPNQFLDEIVPFEKPCVVKVVCLILRRTLGWIDQTGQRRQQDRVAYSEFAREMNMSTQAVADGLKIALEKGYITRVKAGTMRDATSGNPEAACYSLRWLSPLQTPSPTLTPIHIVPVDPTGAIAEPPDPVDSEKQTAQPSLKNRDMINKAESEKINQVELKTSSKTLICKKRSKFSSYIGNLVSEVGEQFGDSKHRLSNIKQALNCWDNSKLSEKEFVQLLYQARNLTRQHTNAITGPSAAGSSKPAASSGSWVTLAGTPSRAETSNPGKLDATLPRNRMPYFFKVLQDLVNRPGTVTSIEKSPAPPDGQLALSNPRTGKPPALILHNSKEMNVLPVEQEVSSGQVSTNGFFKQGVTDPEALNRQQSVAVVHNDPPAELGLLAERFAADYHSALAGWQSWEASLQDPRLKALARCALPVEGTQVRPELQSLLFSPETKLTESHNITTDFLLIFRNAFDARYARSLITEITATLEHVAGQAIEVYITYL